MCLVKYGFYAFQILAVILNLKILQNLIHILHIFLDAFFCSKSIGFAFI